MRVPMCPTKGSPACEPNGKLTIPKISGLVSSCDYIMKVADKDGIKLLAI
jgi:hypothetical protein